MGTHSVPWVLCHPQTLPRHGLSVADLRARLTAHDFASPHLDWLGPEWSLEAALAGCHKGGATLVLAVGGDGTAHQGANLAARLGLPLGLLPLGTANDFARCLNLPSSWDDALAVIRAEAPIAVDLAWVNDQAFLNAAHLGLGVEVAKRTSPMLKRWVGPLAYLVAAAQAVAQSEPLPIEVCFDERCEVWCASQVFVSNGRYFGGGRLVTAEATLNDGLLDVYVLTATLGPLEYLRLAAMLQSGTLARHEHVVSLRVPRLTVHLEGPAEINLDGELLRMESPLHFRVVPGGLKVFARAYQAEPAVAREPSSVSLA